MERLVSICRVCLNENAQRIKDVQLQEIYDKLTTTLFQADITPLSLCCTCLGELQACQRFMLKCLKAEELFSQKLDELLNNDDEVHNQIANNQSAVNQLSTSPVEHTMNDSGDENVDGEHKIEIFFEDDEDTADVKLEDHSMQDLPGMSNCMDLDSYHEQHPSENNLKLSTAQNIETVPEQKTAKVIREDQHGLAKGIAHIIIKPKLGPELNKSTNDINSVSADTDYDIAVNYDSLDNNSKRYSNLDAPKVFEKQDLSVSDSGQSRHIQESNLSSNESHYFSLRPFLCVICNKSFTDRAILIQHARIHSGVKPYVCNVCNRAFNRKEGVQRHMAVHSDARQYVCDVCNKRFFHEENLRRHKPIHDKAKPYVCDVCNKRFCHEVNLRRHKLVHDTARPYVCHVCHKIFARKEYLKKHFHGVHMGVRVNKSRKQ